MPVPELAPVCDCHIHSFEKGRERPGAAYRPPEMDLTDYLPEARANGIARAVIIQASVDGTDNGGLLRALGSAPDGLVLRGVAMISPQTTGLDELAAAGVHALRIQDRTRLGLNDLEMLPLLSKRAAEMGWHIELNTEPERFGRLSAALSVGTKIVLDHFGHIDPAQPQQLEALMRLLDSGRVWVKLAPTRVSQRPQDYRDLTIAVSTLTSRFPDRCVWGSDWPHVMIDPPLPRISVMLDLLRDAIAPAAQRACLWDNPARLYGF